MCSSDSALKIANLISFTSLIVVKGYTTFNEKVAKNYFLLENYHNNTSNETFSNNYLLPKQYTFGISGLIYILLAGFVIRQWSKSANDATISGIRYYFCIAAFLNIIWLIVIWFLPRNHQILILLDALILVALLLVLYLIYNNLYDHYPPSTVTDRIFIHYAFTIYFAWTLIETILNFWIAIPVLNTIIKSTIVIVCLGFIGLYFVDYRKNTDSIFSTTISWALIGIAIKQYETWPILATASFSFGLILGGILRISAQNYISSRI